MASYRYERDIDPRDLAPRKERQYTRKEKWTNWWDYNLKWVLLIGIAAAWCGASLFQVAVACCAVVFVLEFFL